ncbi:hypothetical protein ACIBSV_49920 [Embleya sp. NPDC050154]|uniref:hypothetical protein n=1 Tax=Embleya sp. NPDC050154 TaxID=3363988 RepID=UPI0037BA7093
MTEITRALSADNPARAEAAATVVRFLDVAVAATGRASFYNTRDEQLALEQDAHRAMIALDRRLYAGLVCSPGATDRSRQLGVLHLLDTPAREDDGTAVYDAVAALTVPRRLKLFGLLAERRVNNARVRRLILRSVLGSGSLELWSVRYRGKLAGALRHAWGLRLSGILRSILTKQLAGAELDPKELRILARELDRWAPDPADAAVTRECVAFVLGADGPYTLPLPVAYRAARTDLDAGAALPLETLEGLRGRFHPDDKPARVLALTADRLTVGQRLAGQRQAERAGVEVEVDLDRYDAVRLYLYAFATGMTDEVAAALDRRAAAGAAGLDLAGRRIALVLDGSASMRGGADQPLRPIATVLALRDALRAAAGECHDVWIGGAPDGRLVRPTGATAAAEALVAALRTGAELIVVIGDGYENAPAGRFAQVLDAAHTLGVAVPVVQLSPVLAAEAGGLRGYAPDLPTAPVHRPEALELAWCRLMLATDPAAAVPALLRLAHLEVTG